MSTFRKFNKLVLDASAQIPEQVKRVINQLQTNVDIAVTPLANKSQNDSIVLTDITLTAGKTNTVNTTLGKPLSGWRIVDNNANSNVWRVQNTTNTSTFLYLQCSANCIVSIEVF